MYECILKAVDSIKPPVIINGFIKAGYIDCKLTDKSLLVCGVMEDLSSKGIDGLNDALDGKIH